MGQLSNEQDGGLRLKWRDLLVASAVIVILGGAWLWHEWSRGDLPIDSLVSGMLFLAALLVGVRCIDLVCNALAAHHRFRAHLHRFDRKTEKTPTTPR